MARSEARIHVGIWAPDSDFRQLSPGAQRLYMFLVSQDDVAHTGLLALRERRWARAARGLTEDTVRAELLELAAERFVVFDDDTEEVLIRSFVRRDGVYRQPNLLRAAEKQLPLVASPLLRATLAAELRRVLTAEDIPQGAVEIVERMLKALEIPSPNPSPDPSENPSDTPLGARGSYGSSSDTPYPLDPFPSPLAPRPAPAAPRARERERDPDTDPLPAADRIVIEATGATPSEATAITARIRNERQPRSLPGLLRRMAEDDDLAPLLVEHRAAITKARLAEQMALARDGPDCQHGQPGGLNPHPATGKPLCPKCRIAGLVPPARIEEPA